MIKNIKLKFGRAEGLNPESIAAMPITVFVGPNNSEKSKILTEIQQFCTSGNRNSNNVIIDSIELSSISDDVLDKKIEGVTLKPNPGEAQHPGHIFVGKGPTRHQVPETQFKQALKTPNGLIGHTH